MTPIRAAVVLLPLLLSAPAWARSTGITGYSTPSGCNQCHSGGQIPTVRISGPERLEGGESAIYTLTIVGGAGAYGGLNVAVTDGATLTSISGQGTQRFQDEITHISPKPFVDGEVSWEFGVTASCDANRFSLTGAGNSTNGNGRDFGDFAGFATFQVEVLRTDCSDDGAGPDASTDAPDEVEDEGAFVPLEPDPSVEEFPEGCGCGGDAPSGALLAGLALVGVRRPRRR